MSSAPLKIKATVTNQVSIPLPDLSKSAAKDLHAFLRRELNFFNPKIIDLKRMGYSTWGTPKFINCFQELKSSWKIPTGFLGRLIQYAADPDHDLDLQIDDQRIAVPIEPPPCLIEPKPEQDNILLKIEPYSRAIIEAKPGFGKTMAALLYFAHRAQKTIVIVHTRTLLQQWIKRIEDYFELADPGSELGIIGEGKWKIGSKITIASYQTLLSRGTKSLEKEFGLVIIDECHHVPAQTFTKVAKGFAAKYYLGLSATPFRKDKLDKLMNFYIGPILATDETGSQLNKDGYQLSTLPKESILPPEKTHLLIRETKFFVEDDELMEFTQLGSELIADPARNQLILTDVGQALSKNKGKCLVLSERVGHCEYLAEELRRHYPKYKIALITGQVKKADRLQAFDDIKAGHYDCLIATGSVIGEGFDWPAIDHLFLVYPFSWKGKLIQYVGRSQRLAPGKTEAFIYDYVDGFVSMLKAMARRRHHAYRDLQISPLKESSPNKPPEL